MDKVSYKRFKWEQDALSFNVKDKKINAHTPKFWHWIFTCKRSRGELSFTSATSRKSVPAWGAVQHHWQKTQQTNKAKKKTKQNPLLSVGHSGLSLSSPLSPLLHPPTGPTAPQHPEMLPLHPHSHLLSPNRSVQTAPKETAPATLWRRSLLRIFQEARG